MDLSDKPISVARLATHPENNGALDNNGARQTTRVRSASTGRDKKSDLKARYWSLLFGNLQRAINEIYQTVECYENLSSCQETILVLENYIRDFRALAAWFQVSWDYDATPKPDRRSLAWEVRKCNNPMPQKLRTSKNLSSPAISLKSSPSQSPCPPIAEQTADEGATGTAMKSSMMMQSSQPPTRSDWPYIHMRNTIFGREHQNNTTQNNNNFKHLEHVVPSSLAALNGRLQRSASLGELSETTMALDKNYLGLAIQGGNELPENRKNQFAQTQLEEDHLTLAAYRKKYNITFMKSQTTESETVPKEISVLETDAKISGSVNASPAIKKSATISRTPLVKKTLLGLNRNQSSSIGSMKKVSANVSLRNNPIPTALSSTARKPTTRTNDELRKEGVRKTFRSKTLIEMPRHRMPNANAARASRPGEVKSSTNSQEMKNVLNLRGGDSSDGSLQNPNNDGWLTVKSKRRASWSSRYNKPSGCASLPILTLSDQPIVEANSEVKSKKFPVKKPVTTALQSNKDLAAKPKLAASPRITKSRTVIDMKSVAKSKNSATERSVNCNPLPSKRNPVATKVNSSRGSVMRQKSDLTGLKIKCLHREYMRIEKMQGMSRNEKLLQEDELNSAKVDMKIQTTQDQMNFVNLSSAEDDDDLILEENDDDQRKLLEEQENLERQIRELENTEIEVDTETDETDYEVLIDNEDDDLVFGNKTCSTGGIIESGDNNLHHIADDNMSLEMKYHLLLSEIALGEERLQTLATLQAFVARHPGRAQELHQKLSSPSRRRSLHETLKKYQVKQERAAEKRDCLLKEKAHKIQLLLARVEDVKQAKQQLIDDKRLRMEERLQRATENRTQFLKDKVKKAHDEDEKLREIAFIKSITEQNRRLDLLESSKEHEVRMHDLEQERQKRVEEKAAKEAAAERRRLEIEQERRRRLELISETRREREKRVGKIQQQKEQERQQLATQKAKDREERLQALQAAQQATTKELERKINKKLQESTRRHIELIEHIRQRAQELGVPNRNNDDAVSNHTESDLSSRISDVMEANKGHKKKLRKIKQKLQEKTDEYFKELPALQNHHRRDSEVPKLMNLLQKHKGGTQGYERPLGQLLRIVSKAQTADFHCMLSMDTLGVVAGIIKEGCEDNSTISRRAKIMAIQLYRNICSVCPQLNVHAVLGNSICTLFDVLYTSLQMPDETTDKQPVELSTELMLCCTVAVSVKHSLKNRLGQSMDRLPDVLSYAVLNGLTGALAKRCAKVREPVEQHQGVILSLLATLGLLTNFAQICPKGPLDSTRYLSVAIQTELFGVITLLHSTIFPFGETIPPRTISLAAAIFNLLVTVADLDLATFQTILSEQVLVLKYLDVATVLLKYCGPKAAEKGETQAVIIDLIGTLGFFCINNKRNQDLLTTPGNSAILKSVIRLPDNLHVAVYPTIVAVTWRNEETRNIVAQEFDMKSLDEYQNSQLAKRNKLIGLLK